MANAIVIANTTVRRDAAGRYSLNDLHRAAGGEKRHQPSDWLRIQQTKDLVEELRMSSPEIPGDESIQPLESKAGPVENGGGTYVVRELVYAYTMWISPGFHLKVIRTFDSLTHSPQASPQTLNPANLSRMQLIQLAMEAEQERLLLEQRVAVIEPKAAALDRLKTATEGALNVTVAAKTLQMQPKALFTWLSANGWIYRRPGGRGWIAYQDRIKQGVLEHKVATVTRENGTDKVVEQVLVTAKGLAVLSQRLSPGRRAVQATLPLQ